MSRKITVNKSKYNSPRGSKHENVAEYVAVPRYPVLRVNGTGKDRSLSIIFRVLDDVAGSCLDRVIL